LDQIQILVTMAEDFSFNVQEYFQVDSAEQRSVKAAIARKHQEIEEECKTKTDKETEQRDMKDKLIEKSQELKELNATSSQLGGNQYLDQVRRGGVLCCSDQYGLIYFAKKQDLYIISIATLEARGEMVPVRSFDFDITQIALSSSELHVSICFADSIEIFEARLLRQNVSV
jgi:hypothetical protein